MKEQTSGISRGNEIDIYELFIPEMLRSIKSM